MPRASRAGLVIAIILWAGGCSNPRQEDPLKQGESLFLEGRYEEAIPLLKRCLLKDADHAGAHLYLAMSYMYMEPKEPWLVIPSLVIARGEVETALNLFVRAGKRSPLERFNDTYFELRCQLELVKIFSRLIVLLADAGTPRAVLRPIADECRRAAAEARRIAPDSPDVQWLEGRILKDIDTLLSEADQPREGML